MVKIDHYEVDRCYACTICIEWKEGENVTDKKRKKSWIYRIVGWFSGIVYMVVK